MALYSLTRKVVFQELVARGEAHGRHHFFYRHGAVKDVQQALEIWGHTDSSFFFWHTEITDITEIILRVGSADCVLHL